MKSLLTFILTTIFCIQQVWAADLAHGEQFFRLIVQHVMPVATM